MIRYFFSLFSLASLFVVSCGKHQEGRNTSSPKLPQIEEQEIQGTYKAILRPLNNHLSGFIPTGSAEINIGGDRVVIKTLLDDDASVTHLQNIHLGTRCPDSSDDKNNDGLIDRDEAYRVVGDIFIPLDADLSSATEGQGIYPIGSSFTYVEATSLSALKRDTRGRTGQNLHLSGRVILIHGVADSTQLPSTVKDKNGLSPQASIPIGCGILKRR
jgi:hypothetical protein